MTYAYLSICYLLYAPLYKSKLREAPPPPPINHALNQVVRPEVLLLWGWGEGVGGGRRGKGLLRIICRLLVVGCRVSVDDCLLLFVVVVHCYCKLIVVCRLSGC
jgi:hypothetical protein